AFGLFAELPGVRDGIDPLLNYSGDLLNALARGALRFGVLRPVENPLRYVTHVGKTGAQIGATGQRHAHLAGVEVGNAGHYSEQLSHFSSASWRCARLVFPLSPKAAERCRPRTWGLSAIRLLMASRADGP